MFKLSRILLFLAVALWASAGISAAPLTDAEGRLIGEEVQRRYFEGEFESLRDSLEVYRKTRAELTDADRALLYQYLGVLYGAQPESRKKAESYFFQWLKINPDATLVRLFVSDGVQAIFEEQKATLAMLEGRPSAAVEPSTREEGRDDWYRDWRVWTGAGTVVGAVGLFVLLGGEEAAAVSGPAKVMVVRIEDRQ